LAASGGRAARPKIRYKNKAAAPAHGQKKAVAKGLSGMAGYYSNRFQGRKTASGRIYDKNGMTAAHRSLPLGTWVRVTHQRNGNKVVVQITDRGPFFGSRIIDLSRAAATDLDMLHSGTAPVRLEVVQEQPPTHNGHLLNSIQLAAKY
jgi:rare lipoprotein A